MKRWISWAHFAGAGNFIVGIVGGVSMVFGSIMTYKTHFEHPKLSYIPVDDQWRNHLDQLALAAQRGGDASSSSVLVEVSGAVEEPGVFELSSDSRVQDAILQASGFTDQANKQYIHQELALAGKVYDQQKIYIPFFDEEDFRTSQRDKSVDSVSLNTATKEGLESLSGVGEVRAERILAGIPYSDWNDVAERTELSESILEKIKEKYSL